MGIRELKRWQWASIGLIVGSLLALGRPPADPTLGLRSAVPAQFEPELFRAPLRTGATFVANITVYPPVGGAYMVRFDQLTPSKDAAGWRYVRWCMDAGAIYTSHSDPSAAPETIVAFLKRTSKKHPHVTYRYAWWVEPRWWFALWGGAGVALVGGIWPLALGLLVGRAGPLEKDPHAVEPLEPGTGATNAVAPATLSESDMANLSELHQHLEASLDGFGADSVNPIPAPPAHEPLVKKLDGAAASHEVAEHAERAKREYRGEYYPVAHDTRSPHEPNGHA
jgi:hypothetical protein